MSGEERMALAEELGIPLSKAQAANAEFYMPPEDSPELKYLREHRAELGGPVPRRRQVCPSLPVPKLSEFKDFLAGSGDRQASTTMVMVRLLSSLLRMKDFGEYVVPIVPDEARTFGMDGLFKVAGIYSRFGQQYQPVDADTLLPYREAADGQILQEGICETGAMASFMAAGSAYAVHGLPMIPFYIFYSMFGFQRVGDMIWSCGDMMCRGFLLGGTAGRTTLNGEGLQHEDGHSQILASTVPNLKSYDPATGYELAVIVRDGLYQMYELQEDYFYYLTLYNENMVMPNLEDVASRTGQEQSGICEGILEGIYLFDRREANNEVSCVNLLASGPILQQAILAAESLQQLGITAQVWSVTSFNELERDAQECARQNRLDPLADKKVPVIAERLGVSEGVYVAATDYMKKFALGLAPWIPGPYEVLGTDGYGMSESREALREHFEVDSNAMLRASVAALYRDEQIDRQTLEKCLTKLEEQ